LAIRPDGLVVTRGPTVSLTTWAGIDEIVAIGTHAFFYLNGNNKVAGYYRPSAGFR
jgi:hypothetical protein